MELKEVIRVVPDFKGVSFIDITTLLQNGSAFHAAIDRLAAAFEATEIDVVVGPEARGFAIGAPLAYVLGVGFVPIRKPGKLPAATVSHRYTLEYGEDVLEIHQDAIKPGQKVLIVDDLLATGGTIGATIKLVEQLGGVVAGTAFLVELTYLDGRKALPGYRVVSLVQY